MIFLFYFTWLESYNSRRFDWTELVEEILKRDHNFEKIQM